MHVAHLCYELVLSDDVRQNAVEQLLVLLSPQLFYCALMLPSCVCVCICVRVRLHVCVCMCTVFTSAQHFGEQFCRAYSSRKQFFMCSFLCQTGMYN